MNVNIVYPPWPARRGRVIALHCSGAGAGQWRCLGEALGGRYELVAPEHYGCESNGPWTGEHAFSLADEAARVIALIDGSEGAVHIVGHSYGGGVALHVALARPDRMAGMTLYEPSAFHLLQHVGEAGADAHRQIADIARRITEGVVAGDYHEAMRVFVNYWSGSGAWDETRPAVQHALMRWAPKAPLDFHALLNEHSVPGDYLSLGFPVLILRGAHGPLPTRLIAEALCELLPKSRLITIDGAGHMGPMTHAPEVSGLMVHHIETCEAAGAAQPAHGAAERSLPGNSSAHPMEVAR